jgi:hypothetical protein
MRSMVEGTPPPASRLRPVPFHHPSGGPPPRSGEDHSLSSNIPWIIGCSLVVYRASTYQSLTLS